VAFFSKPRTCILCGKEFVNTNHAVNFCSRSCSAKVYTNKVEYKEKISAASKRNWKDPDYVNKMNVIRDTIHRSAAFKEKMKIISKEVQNRPELKLNASVRMKERFSDPIIRLASSEIQKEVQNRPDIKSRKSEFNKEFQKTDKMRDIHATTMKATMANGLSEETSARMTEFWRNPENAEKRIQQSLKYKEYELPSGRIIKVQGYENQALDILLSTYDEIDILCGVREIHDYIGAITYSYKNAECRYYPDFYIVSTKTIIEVKSKWTFEIQKEKNLAKEQACLLQGFNFRFIII
jgi:hypothetical protein